MGKWSDRNSAGVLALQARPGEPPPCQSLPSRERVCSRCSQDHPPLGLSRGGRHTPLGSPGLPAWSLKKRKDSGTRCGQGAEGEPTPQEEAGRVSEGCADVFFAFCHRGSPCHPPLCSPPATPTHKAYQVPPPVPAAAPWPAPRRSQQLGLAAAPPLLPRARAHSHPVQCTAKSPAGILALETHSSSKPGQLPARDPVQQRP